MVGGWKVGVIPNPCLAACHWKANNKEIGAGERKIDLFKSQQLEKMKDYHKDHLNSWRWAGGFVKREVG